MTVATAAFGRRISPWLVVALAIFCALPASSRASEDLTGREQQAFDEAVARVAKSVVAIETIGGLERVGNALANTGPTTGLVVGADGWIISSAANFVQKPTSILVSLADGTHAPAKLVATDRSRMLTLLKIEVAHPLPVPEISPAKEWRVGQWAIAVGRTYDPAKTNVSVGIVSALDRVWGKAVQCDAKISPANYGGPLVDIRGRAMGVLVPLSPDKIGEMAGVEWYDSGIGFAVPLEQVMKILPRLETGKDLKPGVLGILLKPGDMYADPPVLNAARPNSPALKAGLTAGDTIVEVDGQPIARRSELTRHVQSHYAGDTLHLVVLRDGKRIARDVELADHVDPYRRPLLGILPAREGLEAKGVVVRYVLPESPAEDAGLETGDRIVKLDGQAVVDRDGLATQVAALEIDRKVKIEVLRAGKPTTVEAKLAKQPESVPAHLPERTAKPLDDDELPPLGTVDLQVAEFKQKCLAIVPENYDPGVAHGLLVWLHASGEFERDKLIERWKPQCERHGFILLAPKAANGTSWTPSDLEYVEAAVRQAMADYRVDRLRVAAHGFRTGGALGYLLAFQARDLVRGVAAVHAPLPDDPPDNEPEHRLDFYVVTGKKPADKRVVETLRQAQYAVIARESDASRYLVDDELTDLLRWFDALDKI